MVLAIAHALETHKTISGDDVAAIFEGRQGPKVNGRDYHHPSFVEVADRYHNEALLAHRHDRSGRGSVARSGSRQSPARRVLGATTAATSPVTQTAAARLALAVEHDLALDVAAEDLGVGIGGGRERQHLSNGTRTDPASIIASNVSMAARCSSGVSTMPP